MGKKRRGGKKSQEQQSEHPEQQQQQSGSSGTQQAPVDQQRRQPSGPPALQPSDQQEQSGPSGLQGQHSDQPKQQKSAWQPKQERPSHQEPSAYEQRPSYHQGQPGPAYIRPQQPTMSQPGRAQMNPRQPPPVQPGRAHIRQQQPRMFQPGPAPMNPRQPPPFQPGPAHIRPQQPRMFQPGPAQTNPRQPPPFQPEQTQTRPQQPPTFQPGPAQINPRSGPAEIPQQPGPSQPGPIQPQQQKEQPSAHKDTDLPIPWRKKVNKAGVAGRKIVVHTNHFALSLPKVKEAMSYDVVIEPSTPKYLLRVVMEEFRKKKYPNRYPGYDGSKSLIAGSELPVRDPCADTIQILDENKKPKTFKVTIKLVARVDLTILSQYFRDSDSAPEAIRRSGKGPVVNTQDALKCIDIMLRSAALLHFIPVGRSFFSKPHCTIELSAGMELYYGFFQSAVLGWKPYLNVDVAHKAFPKSQTVVEVIREMCPRHNMNSYLSERDLQEVRKFLNGLKVRYEIPGQQGSKRVTRVNDLEKPAGDFKFTHENRNLTVAFYYSTVKGFNLQYPKLPCLWVGSKSRKDKIVYPAELCTIVEGQVTNRTLTPMQTSKMIKYAATSVEDRKRKISNCLKDANINNDPYVNELGVTVDSNYTTVNARVLEAPTLTYANRNVYPSRGQWRPEKFFSTKQLTNWAILCLDECRYQQIRAFGEMIVNESKHMGMNITMTDDITIMPVGYQPVKAKRDILNAFTSKYKNKQLVLVVIPDNSKTVYTYVKQAAELKAGVLTQCVQAKNALRTNVSTVKNILLKINAKLNGVNHILFPEVQPACFKTPCMIMGADVTHSGAGYKESFVPSVAAVTASHDRYGFQYNFTWRLQFPKQEIIDDLNKIVRHHLLVFYRQNRAKPQKIIFFRDGVSEGQFQKVLNEEVRSIRQAFIDIEKNGTYNPSLTFIVVQKRHHTRLFPSDNRDSEDRNGNVPAGTVVDTVITHPTALDFYLVSHASIQGVARPTKYRMLWDENNMTEDELEKLTYHLCFMFARCTRSVSYPAPTYYAHLAAARAKIYLDESNYTLDDLQRIQDQLKVNDNFIGWPMYYV